MLIVSTGQGQAFFSSKDFWGAHYTGKLKNWEKESLSQLPILHM